MVGLLPADREDHTVRDLLVHLLAILVLRAAYVAERLGVSEHGGRTVLSALASCGVVSSVGVESNGRAATAVGSLSPNSSTGDPSRRWCCQPLAHKSTRCRWRRY